MKNYEYLEWISKGVRYMNEKKYEEALDYFNYAKEKEPSNADIWHYIAITLANLERFNEL